MELYSLDICLLSQNEAARLEHWGIWPHCKSHHHIKKNAALAMIQADTHRFVGGSDTRVTSPVSMIVALGEPMMWQPVPACNADGSQLLGMRIWGRPRTA